MDKLPDTGEAGLDPVEFTWSDDIAVEPNPGVTGLEGMEEVEVLAGLVGTPIVVDGS